MPDGKAKGLFSSDAICCLQVVYAPGYTCIGHRKPGYSRLGARDSMGDLGDRLKLGDVTVCPEIDKKFGRLTAGAQYEYIKREIFTGIGGQPPTDNSIVFTSLRYYPF